MKKNCDNRKFWKVVKLLLSHKIVSNEKLTPLEGEEIFRTGQTNAKVLNICSLTL